MNLVVQQSVEMREVEVPALGCAFRKLDFVLRSPCNQNVYKLPQASAHFECLYSGSVPLGALLAFLILATREFEGETG
jgi:hypothetical protein